MIIVFRREIAKIRSFEAEHAQAHKTTIFSGVSMIDALERRSKVTNTDQKHPSYSSLAQSVERMTVNHDVAGSSPAGGARKKHFERSAFFNDVCLRKMMFAFGK